MRVQVAAEVRSIRPPALRLTSSCEMPSMELYSSLLQDQDML